VLLFQFFSLDIYLSKASKYFRFSAFERASKTEQNDVQKGQDLWNDAKEHIYDIVGKGTIDSADSVGPGGGMDGDEGSFANWLDEEK